MMTVISPNFHICAPYLLNNFYPTNPARVLHLARALVDQCDGSERRNTACQQVALVDQLLLSTTRKILRSRSSSFSDAAISLARDSIEVVSPC